jgi:hypothetical protein
MTIENNTTQAGDSEAAAAFGSLCELMVLDHRYDKNGKITVVPKIENPEARQGSTFSDHALVHRRIFNDKNELTTTRLEINSPFILRVLSEIVKYYPAHPVKFAETFTIESPFMLLYHHWQELDDFGKETDDETSMHLNFLLHFMESELGDDKKKADRLVQGGYISFPLLWTIFRPGSLLLQGGNEGHSQLFRFEQMEYEQDQGGRYLELIVSSVNYDGLVTGRETQDIELRESNVGRGKLITSLDVYPISFAQNSEDIIQRMTQRGEKFLALRAIYVRRYKGLLQLLRRPPLGFFSSDRKKYAGTFTPHTVRFHSTGESGAI